MRRKTIQALSVFFAVAIFTGTTVAPVAAIGDSVSVGSGEGIDIGTDSDADLDSSVNDGTSTETNDSETMDGSEVPDDYERDEPPEITSVDVSGTEIDTKDLPENAQLLRLLLEAVPKTNETGPEDFPIGDERAAVNICDPLNVETDDLPLQLLPSIQDLPEQLQVPGVPSSILSNEALFGILLGLIPAPCEVFNPNDPQIDPTNIPDEPRAQGDVVRVAKVGDGGAIVTEGSATLNESGDGPSINSNLGVLANTEAADVNSSLVLNDGRNDYGIDNLRIRHNDEVTKIRLSLSLVDKELGLEFACQPPEDGSGIETFVGKDLEQLKENPLAPCEVEFIGLPQTLLNPGLIFQILEGVANRLTNPTG
jgi:hypothetical protein